MVYDKPVISLDIFATIAALSAAPSNPSRPLDGVNLIPYLTGKNTGDPDDAIYLRMFDKGVFAVRSGENKLVISGKGNAAELYNLSHDIGESKNLASEEPSILQALEKRRAAWNQQLVEPAFQGLLSGEVKKGNDASPTN